MQVSRCIFAAMFEDLCQRKAVGACWINLRQKYHYPNGHSAKYRIVRGGAGKAPLYISMAVLGWNPPVIEVAEGLDRKLRPWSCSFVLFCGAIEAVGYVPHTYTG